jgi:hypothetical protein
VFPTNTSAWAKTELVHAPIVSGDRERLLSAEGLIVGRPSTDSQSTLNRQLSTDTQSTLNRHDHLPVAGRSSSMSSPNDDEDDDNGSDSEFADIHDPDGRSSVTGSDLLKNLHGLPPTPHLQQPHPPPPPAPSIFDEGLPIASDFQQEGGEFGLNAAPSVKGDVDGSSAFGKAGVVNRNMMLSPDKTNHREPTNSYLPERYVGEMERDNYMPSTPSVGSHQHSPLVGQSQQQRASSVISHTSQQAVGSDAYGAAYSGTMVAEGQSPLSTSASVMYSVNSPATYSSPAFFSVGGFGAPNAMSSMLSSYSSGSAHYGTSAARAEEPVRPADSLFQPGGLGFGSSLPSSSSYGSEGFANRDIFNPYFSDPALSLGLNHSSLSAPDQRALSYMQSLQQRGERSAGSLSSYPMPTSDAFSTTTPPSLQQQHWMSGAAERSRPWGRSSPTLVNPIATSGAAYPDYGFDAGKRPTDSGFAPTSTPGGLGSGSPYGLPSSYMGAAGRSSLGQVADVSSSYGRQKTFEDAYQQMANSYRSLSQGSSSVSDVYGRIGMTPFDKYYYPSDPLYRSQQLAASAASSNSMFLPQSPMYTDRDYLRNPVPGYPAAAASNSYGLGSKLGAGVTSADYMQGRSAGAVDPALQDPYQRSMLYNMMSRYYQ